MNDGPLGNCLPGPYVLCFVGADWPFLGMPPTFCFVPTILIYYGSPAWGLLDTGYDLSAVALSAPPAVIFLLGMAQANNITPQCSAGTVGRGSTWLPLLTHVVQLLQWSRTVPCVIACTLPVSCPVWLPESHSGAVSPAGCQCFKLWQLFCACRVLPSRWW